MHTHNNILTPLDASRRNVRLMAQHMHFPQTARTLGTRCNQSCRAGTLPRAPLPACTRRPRTSRYVTHLLALACLKPHRPAKSKPRFPFTVWPQHCTSRGTAPTALCKRPRGQPELQSPPSKANHSLMQAGERERAIAAAERPEYKRPRALGASTSQGAAGMPPGCLQSPRPQPPPAR